MLLEFSQNKDKKNRGLRGKAGKTGKQGLPGERGEQGLQGEPGLQGLPGIDGKDGLNGRDGQAGPKGSKGDKGDKGERGPRGLPGEDGSTWHDGDGKPKPSLGEVGDYYLDNKSGDYYEKTAKGWVKRGNLTGPARGGGIGSPGPAGAPGVGVPTGGTANQVLTKDSATDYDTSWQDATGGGSITPNTEENLLGSSPSSSGYVIATDTLRGLYYNADNTQWYITSIPLAEEDSNPDSGSENGNNDKKGYGADYIDNKKATDFGIGAFNGTPYNGAMRVRSDVYPSKAEFYIDDQWQDIPIDITFADDNYTHLPNGYKVDVRSGNSSGKVGLNGIPNVREYKVDSGSTPRHVIIDGGNLNS